MNNCAVTKLQWDREVESRIMGDVSKSARYTVPKRSYKSTQEKTYPSATEISSLPSLRALVCSSISFLLLFCLFSPLLRSRVGSSDPRISAFLVPKGTRPRSYAVGAVKRCATPCPRNKSCTLFKGFVILFGGNPHRQKVSRRIIVSLPSIPSSSASCRVRTELNPRKSVS